jgi:ketosteroid isomerase-like protein
MESSAEIRNVIAGWFEAAVRGDAGWRDRHVSTDPDLRIIGTDPDEWLSGPEAYGFLKHEAETVGGKISVSLRSLEGFAEGSVGWGTALPEILLKDGRKVTPRWSAVFHREDGEWKMIHLHASVPISNEAAFGDTFTPMPKPPET